MTNKPAPAPSAEFEDETNVEAGSADSKHVVTHLSTTAASINRQIDLNLDLEEQKAVQTTEIVALLAKHASAKNTQCDDQTMAGHRWGEGLSSVIAQMSASTKRKKRRALDFSDSTAARP